MYSNACFLNVCRLACSMVCTSRIQAIPATGLGLEQKQSFPFPTPCRFDWKTGIFEFVRVELDLMTLFCCPASLRTLLRSADCRCAGSQRLDYQECHEHFILIAQQYLSCLSTIASDFRCGNLHRQFGCCHDGPKCFVPG